MRLTGSQDGAPAPCCLVLMLKAPGRSKRRLGALGTEAAKRLLACAAEDLAAWPGPVCHAPAGPDDARWLERRGNAPGLVVEQRGANLGERIEGVTARLAALGLPRQIFIGIDCPEIDAGYLARAAAALQGADAVLGPATDGGVVLMGTRRPWPGLSGLPWSTGGLYAALAAALEDDGARVATLEPLADVDRRRDLADLAGRLASDPRPARRALVAWLTSNTARLSIET